MLDNFTRQWTGWAHKHGSITRNQAHGSPGNLIDIYAAVDIPECEGFGLSQFHVDGLRQDSLTKKNDSDLSMLKYASSGAHIAGKTYTSSETFTWLTEHFRTSLAQCKPDMDLMFVSGVNHMFFHGTTYSPKDAEWPGWLFYASINMSPTNSIWKDAPAFFQYITRCQTFLQMGQPDNDFLIYLPYMICGTNNRVGCCSFLFTIWKNWLLNSSMPFTVSTTADTMAITSRTTSSGRLSSKTDVS
ncbi:alpha-L-rhamnosidase [Bacteroides reticulotermitis JCM 10512]|uniref:Alpha-L-rhamnosidase n=1 Tax=Bacteroides reticulotermitis JCM 10512 TaxID=1445607 RepID=W4UT25_9BACE|nr:alpha-L-rhamnosidase [Bacteroides reticulotermitis JCM 10512]